VTVSTADPRPAFRAVPNFTALPLFPDYALNRHLVAGAGASPATGNGFSAIRLGRRCVVNAVWILDRRLMFPATLAVDSDGGQ
jgi:hypothetical protein